MKQIRRRIFIWADSLRLSGICIPRASESGVQIPDSSDSFGGLRADSTSVATVVGRDIAPALDEHVTELIEEARAGAAKRASASRQTAIGLGLAFLAVSVPLALYLPTERSASWLIVAGLVATYAVAFRVDFEVSFGSAVPTQLVLVPMFFILPVSWVPLAVAAALFVARVADRPRGPYSLALVFMPLVNAWHALGPALVLGFALGGARAPSWDDWPVYVGALAAQFALDYAVSAIRGRFVAGVGPVEQGRHIVFAYLVDAGLAPIGLAIAFVAYDAHLATVLVLPLLALLAYFSRERRVRIDHALELGHAYRGTAMLLGDVVEADDEYTGHHSRDVVTLVLSVADRMGLDARERRQAEFAALLHDVGKIRIPNEIINKPGPLTPEERQVIETHTVAGQEMLETVGGLLGEVGALVRSCHEHWDGSGYPDGLTGEEIPLVSRIVCACDAFNAMTTDRPYRRALSVEEAVAELRRCSGTQFDPWVVDAIVEHV
jgi:putative nucleotidyltransferase with HDIG domain